MLVVGTHNLGFHADDVLATALLRELWSPDFEVVRTRDPAVLGAADLVLDVGGEFDPARRRFDHHQAGYAGTRSSAGMVLDWLEGEGLAPAGEAAHLRARIVDYVDDVDNGRRAPVASVPCFASLVDAFNQGPEGSAAIDHRFGLAVEVARQLVRGLLHAFRAAASAREQVREAMAEAKARGSRVISLEHYIRWKEPYFELGGAAHPTEFITFPADDGSWRVIAIPPKLGDFGQKRPLPAAWAGLSDAALEAVTGVPGSVFCHKNRFIAVFATRAALDEAVARYLA